MNVEAVLALAAHPTSNRNEAINSLNMLHNYASRKGLSVIDLIRGQSAPVSGFPPIASYLRRIDDLEKEVRTLTRNVSTLEAENKSLKRDNRSLQRENMTLRRDASVDNIVIKSSPTPQPTEPKPEKITIDPLETEKATGQPDISFDEFEDICITLRGRAHGWKTFIAAAIGIETSLIYAWQRKGVVPGKYVADVRNLSKSADRKPKMTKWSADEIARAHSLLGQGMKIKDIAEKLSGEFGREVNENTLKGLKHKMKTGR